jgi:hypothetical protein
MPLDRRNRLEAAIHHTEHLRERSRVGGEQEPQRMWVQSAGGLTPSSGRERVMRVWGKARHVRLGRRSQTFEFGRVREW